jgi:hypothetical protein
MVPATGIDVVDEQPRGALGELELLARRITSTDAPIVLETSPHHTRRARLTWWRATERYVRRIRAASVAGSV